MTSYTTLTLPLLLYTLTTLASPLNFLLQAQNITLFTPPNPRLQAPDPSPGLTAFQWRVLITEGLWKIEAQFPSAYLYTVDSSMSIDPPTQHLPDPKDLLNFTITSYHSDPDGSAKGVEIEGTLDHTTGKADWADLKERTWYGPAPADNLYWPPDHDLFEAAAEVDRAVKYNYVSYMQVRERNVYNFFDGLDTFCRARIDAETLESLPI